MKVKAIATGYWDVVRDIGDEFDVPDDTPACVWFEPVEEQPKKKGGKKTEEPLA